MLKIGRNRTAAALTDSRDNRDPPSKVQRQQIRKCPTVPGSGAQGGHLAPKVALGHRVSTPDAQEANHTPRGGRDSDGTESARHCHSSTPTMVPWSVCAPRHSASGNLCSDGKQVDVGLPCRLVVAATASMMGGCRRYAAKRYAFERRCRNQPGLSGFQLCCYNPRRLTAIELSQPPSF